MGNLLPVDVAIWIVICIVLGALEIFTAGFFVIFFAAGALVAALVALFTDSWFVQLIVFGLASMTFVGFARPILKRTLNIGDKPLKESNVLALIGTEVLVMEPVDKYNGRVKAILTGEIWTACLAASHQETPLAPGSEGVIVSVDGAKLAVRPKSEA